MTFLQPSEPKYALLVRFKRIQGKRLAPVRLLSRDITKFSTFAVHHRRHCAARACALFTVALCAPISKCKLLIRIAQCYAKGINIAQSLNADSIMQASVLLNAVCQASYGSILFHHASIIKWLNAVHPWLNAIRHQYVAQCCASGIKIMHQ